MSKIYRIHGARFLRKYSAAEKTSCYSYMADVRKIANTLCKVPWERVSGDVAATTTIHTEEGLDWNEPERDRFDAAEWCGEHSDGYHRAFAQAACYVFKLPATAVGKAIEKIRVNVTSDPYNPYGARIAAMTSATLEIPMDCDTVRNGEMHRAPDAEGLGAAPRIYVRDAKTGKETWYSNNEIVELTPGSTVTAKQYLFVFVCLENYNRGRDGWIEGSSYIDNDVELTLSAAASDLIEGELNDLIPGVDYQELFAISNDLLFRSAFKKSFYFQTNYLPRSGEYQDLMFFKKEKSMLHCAYMNFINNVTTGSFDLHDSEIGQADFFVFLERNYDGGSKVKIAGSVVAYPFVLPEKKDCHLIALWKYSALASEISLPAVGKKFDLAVWIRDGIVNDDLMPSSSSIFGFKGNEFGGWRKIYDKTQDGVSRNGEYVIDIGKVSMSGRVASVMFVPYYPIDFALADGREFSKLRFVPDVRMI